MKIDSWILLLLVQQVRTSDLSREFPDREIPGKSLKFDSRESTANSREFPGMERVKIALNVL